MIDSKTITIEVRPSSTINGPDSGTLVGAPRWWFRVNCGEWHRLSREAHRLLRTGEFVEVLEDMLADGKIERGEDE